MVAVSRPNDDTTYKVIAIRSDDKTYKPPSPAGMASTNSSYQPVPSSEDLELEKPIEYQPRKYSPKRLILFTLGFLLVAFASYKLGQWSVRSVSPKPAEQTSLDDIINSTSSTSSAATITTSSSKPEATETTGQDKMKGKYSVGYFVNWGIYGRKYPPASIPTQDLTHILYAFANLKGDSGEVFLSDPWADKDIHYPGDSWNDSGNNLYGNLKALYLLKKQNRHLKVLLSIGGWTYSPTFHPVVVNPQARRKFVESSVKILEDYGFDGLDVDYEYPDNQEQAWAYVELLREMRQALDRSAAAKGNDCKFLLTIAAPCGPDKYKKLYVKEMDHSLDFWNLMAYDFAGSWDSVAGHQSNMYGEGLSVSGAVNWYIHQGVARHKIILGVPLYGRSFASTQGPGHSFSGVGGGSWDQGVYDYRALPMPGGHIMTDERKGASWTYDYEKKEMVSFDTEEVGQWKGRYIEKEGLGGAMFWELSGDKGTHREGMEKGPGKVEVPGHSLIKVVNHAMGGLDYHQRNWLKYDNSQFDNMRECME